MVEEHDIPSTHIANIDQTPVRYDVTIESSVDKRCITEPFGISLSGVSLPVKLIYSGNTSHSIPKVAFPDGFSLSTNRKHFSNTVESLRYLREIIIPYKKNQRWQNKLPEDQKDLIVMDVFTGKMTTAALENYKENNILIVNVPADMTKYYSI